jgi:hypothetical protein
MGEPSVEERLRSLEESVATLSRKLDLVNGLVTRRLGHQTPPWGESVLDDQDTDEIRKEPSAPR